MMFGECPKHRGSSMISCSECALERLAEAAAAAEDVGSTPICVYGNCTAIAPQHGAMCQFHEQQVGGSVIDGGCIQRTQQVTCDNLFCQKEVLPGGRYCSDECAAEAQGDLNKYEHVNHPKHYNDHPSGIECIDVIEHMPFNIGTAMKYLWRAGLKPGQEADQDLKKAIWYIERQRTIGERTKR